MDSNHRPLPCQGSALTRLSYGPTGSPYCNGGVRTRQTPAFGICKTAHVRRKSLVHLPAKGGRNIVGCSGFSCSGTLAARNRMQFAGEVLEEKSQLREALP